MQLVHDCSTNTSERELFKIAQQLTVRRQLSFLESESSGLAHALPLFCKSLCMQVTLQEVQRGEVLASDEQY